ncbi:MAG: hypothetical protein ACOYN4_02410 [Bacteroidales bacterium]
MEKLLMWSTIRYFFGTETWILGFGTETSEAKTLDFAVKIQTSINTP